jgi:2-keto-4-pentenoate hydratase/2-oxohepta-3-ene-1,7-dioic acid hydratase in catechol pathway
MKLLRFGAPGRERPGLLDAHGVIRDLSFLVDDWAGAELDPDRLAVLDAVDPASLPEVRPGVRLGPCVGQVGKFICIGLNYADHAAETGADIPVEPTVFMKATSAIAGPSDDLPLPRGSRKTDWEVELGVVVGRSMRHVPPEDALSHVAGYCVINDYSEREWQLERGGQWDKGKGCDGFGPLGPWLVTPDEVPNPQNLALWLEVNGRRMQDGSTGTMIFSVAQCLSYLSQFMSLHPGDVVSTGTPPGVGLGMRPPLYLGVGDQVRLGIEGLGEQGQTIVASR